MLGKEPVEDICESWCDECGCCEHGEYKDGCLIFDAPYGTECPNTWCDCEGEGRRADPMRACRIADYEEEEEDRQLHQLTKLW